MIKENLSLKNKSLFYVSYRTPDYLEDDDTNEASPEELAKFIEYIYSENDTFQDIGISFLTSSIKAVNESILTRIMSLGVLNDGTINFDLAPQILSFLGYLVQSVSRGVNTTITYEMLLELKCLDFIYLALGINDNLDILREVLKSLNKFINVEMFALWFIKNNVFERLFEILKHLLEQNNTLDEDDIIKSIEYIFNFMNLAFRNPKLYLEMQNIKDIIPEIYLHVFSLGQENTKTLKQSTIAMNSLQFYFSVADDQILQLFLKTNCFINMVYSYIQKGGNYIIVLISVLLVITGHSDDVVVLTIPFVEKLLELFINSNDNISVEFLKLLTCIIRNYAACDDQKIFDFLLSDVCMRFLLKVSSPQIPYYVQVQVHLIIYFLSMNQSFHYWILNNFQIEMLTEKISEEPEYLMNYFSSLISFGNFLQQTDSNKFNIFLEELQNNNIEETISDTVLNHQECEQLLSIANQLQEFLSQYI